MNASESSGFSSTEQTIGKFLPGQSFPLIFAIKLFSSSLSLSSLSSPYSAVDILIFEAFNFHRAVPPEFQSLVSVEGGEVVYSSINNNIVNILFFNNAHLKSQKMILVFDYPPALQGGEGEWGRCKFCHALAFKGQIVSQVLFHLVFTMFFLFLFLIIIRLPDAGRE